MVQARRGVGIAGLPLAFSKSPLYTVRQRVWSSAIRLLLGISTQVKLSRNNGTVLQKILIAPCLGLLQKHVVIP